MGDLNIKLANIEVDGINLNNTELVKITEQIFNIKPILEQELQNELNPLKKEANIYILKMQKALQSIKRVIELYKKKQVMLESFFSLNENANAVSYAENHNQLKQVDILNVQKQLIVLTDLFTVNIQNILGKNMQLVYIYQSKAANNVQVFKIDKIEDLLKIRSTSSGGIDVRLSATKKFLQKNAQLIPKEDYVIGEEQATLLDTTYKQIIRRYNTYRYGYTSLVLWNMKSRPKWHGMKLYQRGDLSQTYGSFVFNRQASNFIGNVNSPPETDIQLFMSVVEGVDATFGGIQGDIYDESRKTQIAVKSLSASPQQILSTIEMAKDLMTGNINVLNFEKYKEKWIKEGRNTIEKFTEKTVKAQLQSLKT